MNKIIGLLLICTSILVSCKTSSKVTESSKMKSNEKIDLTHSNVERKDINENKDINSELETTTVKTEYYAPGSTLLNVATGDSTIVHVQTGAVKSITTTITKEKTSDKSKIKDNSQKQEGSSLKKEGNTEVKSQKSEVIKKGLAQWKIVCGIVILLLIVYFLGFRMGLIGKLLKWIKSSF